MSVARPDSTGSSSNKGDVFLDLFGHPPAADSRCEYSCCESCARATVDVSYNNKTFNDQVCLGRQKLPARPSPPSMPEPESSRFMSSYRTRRKRCSFTTGTNNNKKFALATTLLVVASLVDPALCHGHVVQPFWRDEHFAFPAIESTTMTSNSSDHRQFSHAQRFLLDSDSCSVVEECRNCDSVSRSQIKECQLTGRIERWKCGAMEGGGKY